MFLCKDRTQSWLSQFRWPKLQTHLYFCGQKFFSEYFCWQNGNQLFSQLSSSVYAAASSSEKQSWWWFLRYSSRVGQSKHTMRHSNTSQSWERFENIVEVHNCPNMTILNSIFGPCLFVYSHFHLIGLFVFSWWTWKQRKKCRSLSFSWTGKGKIINCGCVHSLLPSDWLKRKPWKAFTFHLWSSESKPW